MLTTLISRFAHWAKGEYRMAFSLWVCCCVGLTGAASTASVSVAADMLPSSNQAEIAPQWMADTVVEMQPDSAALRRKQEFDALEALSKPVDTTQVVGRELSPIPPEVAKTLEPLKKAFVPVPQRALWLSLVLPGAGQIYNRKYWKLPLVYGGFLGCTYAFLWNQQMYMDYSQAYLDIMDDDPNTNSYRAMFPPTYDIDSRLEQFKTVFKNRKDRYRRYRDMSAFCFIGVYLLSVIDAYVDAQLSVFDISPDLSLRIAPTTFGSVGHSSSWGTTGIGATLTF